VVSLIHFASVLLSADKPHISDDVNCNTVCNTSDHMMMSAVLHIILCL